MGYSANTIRGAAGRWRAKPAVAHRSGVASAASVPGPESWPVASAPSGVQTWLSPSVRQLTFFLCLGYSIVVGGNMLSADGDPSRHLVVGERMLATASIPHRDLFSHTMAGRPFVPYEWLAEVASAASFRVAGLAGPVLLHGAVFGLALVLLFQQVRDRGHSLAAALATVLGTLSVTSIHW